MSPRGGKEVAAGGGAGRKENRHFDVEAEKIPNRERERQSKGLLSAVTHSRNALATTIGVCCIFK